MGSTCSTASAVSPKPQLRGDAVKPRAAYSREKANTGLEPSDPGDTSHAALTRRDSIPASNTSSQASGAATIDQGSRSVQKDKAIRTRIMSNHPSPPPGLEGRSASSEPAMIASPGKEKRATSSGGESGQGEEGDLLGWGGRPWATSPRAQQLEQLIDR
ncbi:hypothetical protein T484DRAFT_1903978 [Baffinella frigidus]|nr:hypothetical protein T484DRAFT_1903978 [Cryptophyta sp. CCMP2293]